MSTVFAPERLARFLFWRILQKERKQCHIALRPESRFCLTRFLSANTSLITNSGFEVSRVFWGRSGCPNSVMILSRPAPTVIGYSLGSEQGYGLISYVGVL